MKKFVALLALCCGVLVTSPVTAEQIEDRSSDEPTVQFRPNLYAGASDLGGLPSFVVGAGFDLTYHLAGAGVAVDYSGASAVIGDQYYSTLRILGGLRASWALDSQDLFGLEARLYGGAGRFRYEAGSGSAALEEWSLVGGPGVGLSVWHFSLLARYLGPEVTLTETDPQANVTTTRRLGADFEVIAGFEYPVEL